MFDPVTCAFTAARGEVVGSVDTHVVEVETDQVVVAGHGLGGELFEDAGVDPFVAAGPQCGVRHGVS